MAKESPYKPFYSVLVLAFACSVLVATAAVGLRPLQEANRSLDRKKNILAAAGILDETRPLEEQFAGVETRLVELVTGRFVTDESLDPMKYDPVAAAMSDETGKPLSREDDPAGIRRLEKYAPVYLVNDKGRLRQIVLPVRGKGLWSTLYAYVAIDADLTTINGISFYEHGETPGLGGEVENPRWQRGWQGKSIYTTGRKLAVSVVKSGTQVSSEEAPYRIDGLTGATITTQGVDQLMRFWFGDHGFKPFLDRIRSAGGVHD